MASTRIYRTAGSPTLNTKHTISMWLKRTKLTYGDCFLIDGYKDGNNRFKLNFDASDRLELYNTDGGSYQYQFRTNKTFRDTISQETQQCDLSIWTNVNEPGSINELHTHKGVSFACTYNLQTEGTGNLVFRNPANLLNDCNQKSPFIRNYKIEPKDGDLLVWPAWVPHFVEENKSNKQRINIATNINLVGVDNA